MVASTLRGRTWAVAAMSVLLGPVVLAELGEEWLVQAVWIRSNAAKANQRETAQRNHEARRYLPPEKPTPALGTARAFTEGGGFPRYSFEQGSAAAAVVILRRN